MTVALFFAFVVAVIAASVIPGPAVFALVARTLSQGMRPGIIMALGLVSGDLVYFLVAVAGLSGLVVLIGEFLVLLKFAGAAYLIYLGWTFLSAKPSAHVFRNHDGHQVARAHESWLRIYLSGLLITLGNPKTMIFFFAVLPALLDLQQVVWQDAVVLGLTVFVISFAALLMYGGLADNVRNLFQSKGSVRRLNQGAGGVLIACGAALVLRD